MHVPSLISAEESEEIGVEHLLRSTTSSLLSSTNDSLSTRVTAQLSALKGLHSRLIDIRDYLSLVLQGKMNVNHQILYNLQDVFNLLPAGMGEGKDGEQGDAEKSFRVQTNDQMVVVYLSSLIRAVIALHNLSVHQCMPTISRLASRVADCCLVSPYVFLQGGQQVDQLACRV